MKMLIYQYIIYCRRQTAEEREQERQAATKYFLSMQVDITIVVIKHLIDLHLQSSIIIMAKIPTQTNPIITTIIILRCLVWTHYLKCLSTVST